MVIIAKYYPKYFHDTEFYLHTYVYSKVITFPLDLTSIVLEFIHFHI